jgi:hypothetical protein
MSYSSDFTTKLRDRLSKSLVALDKLTERAVLYAERHGGNEALYEFLVHGVGRRTGFVGRCAENVFASFPPESKAKLGRTALLDTTINLQAFLVNLMGLFDNWAWAYVHRHDISVIDKRGEEQEDKSIHRNDVDLFRSGRFRKRLPLPLKQYFTSDRIRSWFHDYAVHFRDGLVHRIALYVPPAHFSYEAAAKYRALEEQRRASLRAGDLDREHAIHAEMSALGEPAFSFHNSLRDNARQAPIHVQIVSDVLLAIESGGMFLKHMDVPPQ